MSVLVSIARRARLAGIGHGTEAAVLGHDPGYVHFTTR